MALSADPKSMNKNVFILAVVTQAEPKPNIALYVDPWRLYCSGTLSLTTLVDYLAFFRERPASVTLLDTGHFGGDVDSIGGMPLYRYKRLHSGQIRLLKLAPGVSTAPLEGTILHVSLASPPEFSTISYVWGEFNRGNIAAGGSLKLPDGRCIFFPISLWAALHAVRHPIFPVMLWADAICINQADTPEKIQRIQRLPNVFAAAKTAYAWLGHEPGWRTERAGGDRPAPSRASIEEHEVPGKRLLLDAS